MGCILAVVFLAFVVALPSAVAKKERSTKDEVDTVAIFLSATGSPDAKIFGTIAIELTKLNHQFPDLKPLWGKYLKKELNKKPDLAITQCRSDVRCIARLGARTGADHVLYARTTPAGTGVRTQFVVIDVASQKLEKRVEMEVSTAGNVAPVLAATLDEMFADVPAALATASEDEEISLDAVLDNPLPAVASASTGETTGPFAHAEVPFQEDDHGDDPEQTTSKPTLGLLQLDARPGNHRSITLSEPFLNATEPQATDPMASLDADDSFAGATTMGNPQSSGESMVLTFTGIGVAALGCAALGAGGLAGLQSSSKRAEIEYGQDGTSQLDARDINDEANELANRANLLYGVGGGLVLVGAGLVVLDMLLSAVAPEASTSLSAGAGASGVVIGWKY